MNRVDAAIQDASDAVDTVWLNRRVPGELHTLPPPVFPRSMRDAAWEMLLMSLLERGQ